MHTIQPDRRLFCWNWTVSVTGVCSACDMMASVSCRQVCEAFCHLQKQAGRGFAHASALLGAFTWSWKVMKRKVQNRALWFEGGASTSLFQRVGRLGSHVNLHFFFLSALSDCRPFLSTVARYGKNEITPPKRENIWIKLLRP